MSDSTRLVYFDIRGRAEPIRLLLEEMEVAYIDEQILQEDWPAQKPTFPFGHVPAYYEGDYEISQTYAILQYLGRKHDLLGKTEAERIRCDTVIEAFRDLGERATQIYGASSQVSEETRNSFLTEDLPARIELLESFYLADRSDSGLWVGGALTIADFVAFYYLDGFFSLLRQSGTGDNLSMFRECFANRPRIKSYIESGRRPDAIMFGPKGKIYPPS